jgi:hypothetical protein
MSLDRFDEATVVLSRKSRQVQPRAIHHPLAHCSTSRRDDLVDFKNAIICVSCEEANTAMCEDCPPSMSGMKPLGHLAST